MLDKVPDLIAAIDELGKLVEAKTDWSLKYDLFFRFKRRTVDPLIEELDIDFDWHDPDMGYEDDVRACHDALRELRSRLLPLVED